MEIYIENLQKKVKINSPRIKRIITAILKSEKINKAALSVVFVSSQKIKALNRQFLKRNHVTDVLAFDFSDQKQNRKRDNKKKSINADIIICVDRAKKNAQKYEVSLSHELVLYIIHGILHLIGFNDHNINGAKRMRQEEQKVLDRIRPKILKIIH